jgi:hypothetical protein
MSKRDNIRIMMRYIPKLVSVSSMIRPQKLSSCSTSPFSQAQCIVRATQQEKRMTTQYLIGVRAAARRRRGRQRDNVRVPREIDGARLHALGKLGARGGDW